MTVRYEPDGSLVTVTIDRPDVRNAVDPDTARLLVGAFEKFAANDGLLVAVLTGAGGHFCAGFDLKALARGAGNQLAETGPGPIGPTRMLLDKPVIAAIEGYAVAGGMELALWCDLRVAARGAALGGFNRRFGVPLIDLGTIRLPRMIGQGRAMDLVLTGRPVSAVEALGIGLVERLAPPRMALTQAMALGQMLAELPRGGPPADRPTRVAPWASPI